MKFIYKLDRKFGRYGIPNLMIYVTATMFVVFLVDFLMGVPIGGYLTFNRYYILRGEFWRLITFAFLPPSYEPLWLLLGLYFYYFIGNTLEDVWGPFRFTLYYVFGIVGAVIAGFIAGGSSNIYLNMSLFFAFAHLFPDYEVLLFFIIPVKVKYLAYLNGAFFFLSFLSGTLQSRMAIIFSIANYFIFFGPEILQKMKNNARYSKSRREFRKNMGRNNDRWR